MRIAKAGNRWVLMVLAQQHGAQPLWPGSRPVRRCHKAPPAAPRGSSSCQHRFLKTWKLRTRVAHRAPVPGAGVHEGASSVGAVEVHGSSDEEIPDPAALFKTTAKHLTIGADRVGVGPLQVTWPCVGMENRIAEIKSGRGRSGLAVELPLKHIKSFLLKAAECGNVALLLRATVDVFSRGRCVLVTGKVQNAGSSTVLLVI